MAFRRVHNMHLWLAVCATAVFRLAATQTDVSGVRLEWNLAKPEACERTDGLWMDRFATCARISGISRPLVEQDDRETCRRAVYRRRTQEVDGA